MVHVAYIGLGSNLGNRKENLMKAVEYLRSHGEIEVEALSSVYETAPVGVKDQPPFLNMAVKIKTVLEARNLLETLKRIEERMGRRRTKRWGPRVIDLDILLFDRKSIRSSCLQVPHPRILERAFVLIPLLEIDPEISLPDGTLLKDAISRIDTAEQAVSLFKGD